MIFVTDIQPRNVSAGQEIFVFGGFFDNDVSVTIGGVKTYIVDSDESMLQCVVPDGNGKREVVVKHGTKEAFKGSVNVVGLSDTETRAIAKNYSQTDFDNFIRSLFPYGKAFDLSRSSNFSKLIGALASVTNYVWQNIRLMLKALDPTHTENLSQWEEELNLPVIGINPETDAGRRAEIYRAECTNGASTKGYIQQILSLMGIDADVYEYTKDPEMFEGVDFAVTDDKNFFLKINFRIDENDFSIFECGESCAGDYLLDFGKYKEEEIFNKTKQSHVKIVFGYDTKRRNEGYLLQSNGGYILLANGGRILVKK